VGFVNGFVQCQVFTQSPPCRNPNVKYPVELPISPDWCQNVSLALLFDSNGNSFTVSMQSEMCVSIHIFVNNIEMLVGQKK